MEAWSVFGRNDNAVFFIALLAGMAVPSPGRLSTLTKAEGSVRA
jgi:hypothetical protein